MKAIATRVSISDSVVHAVLGDEIVLFHSASGVYYGLADVGSRIWELLKQDATTEDEIVRRLLREYDVSPAQLRLDVQVFLQLLRSKRLTRVINE